MIGIDTNVLLDLSFTTIRHRVDVWSCLQSESRKPRTTSSSMMSCLREALRAYRAGPGDFSDYLIGLRNTRAGCDHTVTFDRALKKHASFVLL